jgi:hypothetical protein
MNSIGEKEKWDRILELYQKSSRLRCLSQEIDLKASAFMQPTIEFSYALDHILKSVAADLQSGQTTDHLDRAMGHIARAFFDSADWITLNLQNRISQLLGNYTSKVISDLLPEYYTDIRPTIDQLVALRKELPLSGDFISKVNQYEIEIKKLLDFLKKAEKTLPTLTFTLEVSKKKRVAKAVFFGLLWALIGALCSLILSYLLQVAR